MDNENDIKTTQQQTEMAVNKIQRTSLGGAVTGGCYKPNAIHLGKKKIEIQVREEVGIDEIGSIKRV